MRHRSRVLLLLALVALVATPVAAQDAFDRCLAAIRVSRAARRVTPATWQALDGVRPDTVVLAQRSAQPEFRLPVWDYVAVMADSERVADGLARLHEHEALFARVADRYGVDAATVAAVWGIESNFGRNPGAFDVLTALATLACDGSRRAYFRGELIGALQILQGGHVTRDRFRGSWAGAFGQTQFMPGIFWGRAVDFDGDGRRDLYGSTADALASTANYLRLAGWTRHTPWGIEVRLPQRVDAPFDAHAEGRRVRRSLAAWAARGVVRADGSPLLQADTDSLLAAGLLLPAGVTGPAFLVTANFEAIYRYNAAESYALAIAHLSDRLRGGGPILTGWPTDDPGLSRADRRELQRLLSERGHVIGAPDGLLTPPVRDAVKAEQARLGQPVTGRPGQRLLAALRAR